MKDLFSKITFGFLMAQFLPGCIAVVAVTMLLGLGMNLPGSEMSILGLMDAGTDYWFGSDNAKKPVLFLFLSTGAGMAIHGLNWMMVGFIERLFGKLQTTDSNIIKQLYARWVDTEDFCALRDNFWHRRHIIIQLVLGPVWIVVELFLLLIFTRGVNDMLIDENVHKIPKDKMEAFEFLQSFYLSFSQFFMHTSYALTLFLIPAIICSGEIGFNERLGYFLMVYFMASYFFLVGRVQASSLFNAESKLKAITDSNKQEEPDTIIVQIKQHS